ncbi:tRNA uridine-5-carboxymethylaminomethyl(34) synthesis GTPase MnmE [Chitinimonas sp. BJB300]|uniref:tRNA uridine-5-carboxymethylaminomethyl(34) synthesis GTPase MnmE n=1 Tax=Chitinimonas sp. BJB300 TaxID=1559339 RepID=UPI000C0CCE57|nr:tRNA uridine-5-carboxymethylaminomethyl(34) synthesis GTPase MnmE [Chitinimonas sp. BJB300]PHV11792.1 tRNA uridine-5-carboxymethylaminomethyl(34) synthesis GTPase MnmE [Chitinimonas sp. BJB300]TSJ91207.1 tRNA uridine-5-carboxymethylaminomethyl(34) synthesis GTPase MnmE [Chitinimonas sp. BJB300]
MTQLPNRDTIAAIATAPGRGGVGVVRISGSNLTELAVILAGKPLKPRYVHYVDFRAGDGELIDQGLAIFFPGPHSFTGEDVLELQGHGGPVVMQMLLRRCLELGTRLAEPGEFTRRAFLNDKLDLAQAESVADLIDAGSESAARSALRSLAGAFSTEIHTLVEQLINLRMLVEATLDFPEEDIDFLEAADARGKLAGIHAQLDRVARTAKQGSLLREGMHVVLIGQPNVGKSSLMNALAGEEVAIVTDIAGTTRDTVRELIQLDGVPMHIIDTAGLRETNDTVEKIGIERTWGAVQKADLALLLIDSREGITEHDRIILARLPDTLPRVHVFNKVDLTGESVGHAEEDGHAVLRLSAKAGLGLDELKHTLLKMVGWGGSDAGIFLARERHLDAIRRAGQHLNTAALVWQQVELFAEELRIAQNDLASITGEFSADDLLGEIFSRFCIGK